MANHLLRRNAIECTTRDGTIDAVVDPEEAFYGVLGFLLQPSVRNRINAHPRGTFSFDYGPSPSCEITFKTRERIA